MDEMVSKTIGTLSGGEKVAIALVLRLSIAAALAEEALELMLMDVLELSRNCSITSD